MELHQMPQNQVFSHGFENMSETARNDRILCWSDCNQGADSTWAILNLFALCVLYHESSLLSSGCMFNYLEDMFLVSKANPSHCRAGKMMGQNCPGNLVSTIVPFVPFVSFPAWDWRHHHGWWNTPTRETNPSPHSPRDLGHGQSPLSPTLTWSYLVLLGPTWSYLGCRASKL